MCLGLDVEVILCSPFPCSLGWLWRGLVRGKGLGSGGDSQGADGAEVLGLVRGVSGSPSADLVKEEAVSMV